MRIYEVTITIVTMCDEDVMEAQVRESFVRGLAEAHNPDNGMPWDRTTTGGSIWVTEVR